MKTKIFLTVTVLFLIISAIGQNPTIELTFTAIDSAAYVQLDSIKVMNCTQGRDTTLCWPDTVLVLDYQVGIHEISDDIGNLQVFQNYPNPVVNHTTISLYVPDKDEVGIIITDMLGRMILKSDRVLDKGIHSFRFAPGSGSLFFFTANWRGKSSSIKILQATSKSYRVSSLEYLGSEASSPQLKATEDIQSFSFSLGDELLYIGYANTLQSGMLDAPEASQDYIFQFATNIPCPGTPTVEYEGLVYNTIQIFSLCWLKENLNVGTMIPGTQEMTDDGIMEKYCYNNEEDNCDIYGGLYQWDEMMQYTTTQGVQGICPPGWHIPTDEEWKVLEGCVDSQYGVGDPGWDYTVWRGYDAGLNMKSTIGWYGGGNGTDLFGFSGLPGGHRYNDGGFNYVGNHGGWWSATEGNDGCAWGRGLDSYGQGANAVGRYCYYQWLGLSVRCLRDY